MSKHRSAGTSCSDISHPIRLEKACPQHPTMPSCTFYGPQSFVSRWQGAQRKVQLMAICTALLVVSLSASTAQSRGLTHHIDKRNSNIDPFWYVDRGVRPIGRFGKRQMTNSNLRHADNLELILNALREQNAIDSNQQQEGEVMY